MILRAHEHYCEVESYHLMIYNRWGQRVFETTDIEQGWTGEVNGKMSPSDVYIYKIEYGFGENRKSVVQSGDVTLIR